MISFYYDHYKVNVTHYINTQGNTSYILRFYRVKLAPLDGCYSANGCPLVTPVYSHAYTVVRYQWAGGSCYYLWEDSDGVCIPAPCRMKLLVPGFNWSYARRAIRKAVCYGK